MKFLHSLVVTPFFAFGIFAHVKAQAPPPPPLLTNDSSKTESITITKKNPSKEKLIVVIDSNNITINGKPVEDFKSDDIDITKNDLPDFGNMSLDFSGDNAPDILIAPHPADPRMLMMNGQLRKLHEQMNTKVTSNNAFLGVMSEKNEQGAKITDITKASAAEKAGLKAGDIITKINDEAVKGPDDLYKIIGKHKPADNVTITYLRDGKTSTAKVVLGKSNQMHVYSWNAPNSDFSKDFNKDFNHNFSLSWNDDKPRLGITAQDTEDGNGVKVTGIDDEDAAASKAGLKEDDIITQVNGKTITSVDDLKESMKDVKKGDTVKITYKRNNQTQTADVKFPKELKSVDL